MAAVQTHTAQRQFGGKKGGEQGRTRGDREGAKAEGDKRDRVGVGEGTAYPRRLPAAGGPPPRQGHMRQGAGHMEGSGAEAGAG